MSDPSGPIGQVDVDVQAWVEAVKNDPVLYLERQVTEITLTAIGLSPSLSEALVLKGGTLMSLAFKSDRVTGDVDFTALPPPDGFPELLAHELNKQLPAASAKLGYLDISCRVQKLEKRPRPQNFENLTFPALLVRIGYARKGTNQERMLEKSNASNVIDLEVTFRDQVYQFQELCLLDAAVAVQAFSLAEIIAEKLRALLQQTVRDRYRRQDVFDIGYLIDNCPIDSTLQCEILRIFVLKCTSRKIEPSRLSLRNPEIKSRAQEDWDTIELEIDDLPDFEQQYEKVLAFYEGLPWGEALAK